MALLRSDRGNSEEKCVRTNVERGALFTRDGQDDQRPAGNRIHLSVRPSIFLTRTHLVRLTVDVLLRFQGHAVP